MLPFLSSEIAYNRKLHGSIWEVEPSSSLSRNRPNLEQSPAVNYVSCQLYGIKLLIKSELINDQREQMVLLDHSFHFHVQSVS